MATSGKQYQWLVFDTAEALAIAVKERILELAHKAINERGEFKIVLAGGTTPELVYKHLSVEGCCWNKWQFFLGDERCLPISDKQRNSSMIYDSLLSNINIPQENVHLMAAEFGAEQAAEAYGRAIRNKMPFDLVLLGMGEDGHTASLFPGHQHNFEELAHAVHDSPKPPPDRVSLSVKSLSNSREVIIIIAGANKRQIVKRWRAGEALPVAAISSLGSIRVMLDKAAFADWESA